jgi:hypothetical protein
MGTVIGAVDYSWWRHIKKSTMQVLHSALFACMKKPLFEAKPGTAAAVFSILIEVLYCTTLSA